MNNEELILQRLEELTEAVREAKAAVRPMTDLKNDLEPVVRQIFNETIDKLSRMTAHTDPAEIGELLGTTLSSAGNLAEGLRTLNGLIELKKDLEPISKGMFQEAVSALDMVSHGFSIDDLTHLLHQTVLSLGNLAEGLKTINAIMELKETITGLSQPAFADLIDKLEDLKSRGVLDGIAKLAQMGEKMAVAASHLDLSKAKPVTGMFGMLGALKDPKVQ
ncbi:MAG: hypothetical protein A2527_09970, partial [Candidatus Lambdaproteobacteria bacterium RIFOXYD2_FULL_50_16]